MGTIPVLPVLFVGSDQPVAETIRVMFNDQGSYAFELKSVGSIDGALEHLGTHPASVVLLDFELSDVTGLDALSRIHIAAPYAPIVLLCTEDDESIAIETTRGYVQDYLLKGQVEAREMMRSLRSAIALKRVQELQLEDTERSRVTLNSIGDAVICTDKDGRISYLNPIAESMTGWPLKEVAGLPLTDAFHIIDDSTGLTAANPMEKKEGEDKPRKLPANCILRRRDGGEIYIEDSVAPIHDGDGLAAGWVLVFRDVSAAHAAKAKLTHLCEHDGLTGLPNRLLLNDRLGQATALAARNGEQLAVLFLDLDNFKNINDTFGHRTGDMLLKSVARCLEKCVRSPDTVSRQGGDEFVILLSDGIHPDGAATAAGRILDALSHPHHVLDRELHISASLGIAIFPDDGIDAETLIRNADIAMYQAKENGRHAFRFFEPEMNTIAVERQSLEEELGGALGRKELELYYQPKICLKSGAITGVEALLRWSHAQKGDIPPARFIPVAESSGLILPIGAWVLREACNQAKAWAAAGRPAIVTSVNVSSRQFRDENFLDQLFAIVDESGLSPELLEIEFTEGVLTERPELMSRILHAVRKKGIRISIDDFGTGYSSLSSLAKFPLDAIKIDKSFVHQITESPEKPAIVSAIIAIARSLKLRVVAEGVETSEELDYLNDQGCDEAQGFLFSRPVTPDRLLKLLDR